MINVDNDIVWNNNEFPKIIWTMWQQGRSSNAETVKATVKTIKRVCWEKLAVKFQFVNRQKILSVLSIFQKILQKNIRKKKLSAAHYSDIVRFSLLYKYGGIWMDATLFVSPYATLEMFEGDFFSLNHPPFSTNEMERTICDYKWSGYCLAGKKKKSYFKHIRDIYIYYVRKYPLFLHYLMMDYFILSEYDSNPKLKV